ncbi:MAG: VCBS repeat-containing protein [Candidatus Eisenbacteria bacterium]
MRALVLASMAFLLPLAGPSAAGTFSHPNRVLAGVWQIPFFYPPAETLSLPATIRCSVGSDTAEAELVPLPRLGGGPRYGAFVEEPLLAQRPGTSIRVEVLLGDSTLESASVPVDSRPSPALLATADEESGVVLWAEDGAGGFSPLDTARASSPVREVLLLRTRRGSARVVGATDAGEAIVWSADGGLREIARHALGGSPSCGAAGASSLDGYFGLLDGRIVRVRLEGAGEAEVVASAEGIPTSLALGDADDDGTDDLAATVLEIERSNLVVWRGLDDDHFDRDRPRVILLPGTGRNVLFAPLDRDPELLLLLHAGDVDLSGVLVWSLAGVDSVRVIDLPGISHKSVHRLVGGDWNGDGVRDLAVLTGGSRSLLEFFLMDEGGSPPAPACAVPVSGPEVGLVAGDFDGNGSDDLLVVEGRFGIWLSDGTGRMAALPNPPRGAPARAALLDLP